MIRRIAAALALLLIVGSCSGLVGIRGGLGERQVKSLPKPTLDAYEVFAYKCSRCHTLARPLSAQVRDLAHWREYVDRMRRQPGSGISPDDEETILQFLKYLLEHRDEIEANGPLPKAITSSTAQGGQPR